METQERQLLIKKQSELKEQIENLKIESRKADLHQNALKVFL